MLRVGLLERGRIIEERIVRGRDSVSIGQSARSTFVVAHPLLPAHHVLFEARGDDYVLDVRPYMAGRVTTSGGELELAGRARIPLDGTSRGRIVLGDVTLLFQFVHPPPVHPRPQLPASVRGAWLREAGSLFGPGEGFIGLVWLVTLAACAGLVLFFHLGDWPVEPRSHALDDRWIDLIARPPDDIVDDPGRRAENDGDGRSGEENPDEEQAARDEVERPEGTAPRSRPQLSEEQKAALAAERKARLEAALARYGITAVVGSKGGPESGQALADLMRGSGVVTDIDELMKGVTKLQAAAPSDAWSKLDLPAAAQGGGQAAELDLRDAQAADAEVSSNETSEKAPRGRTKLGPIEEGLSPGILDQAKVVATVKKSLPALRNCYEKGLGKNPLLEGKISVDFTIGTAGRVTSATAKVDTLGDPAVTACVLGKFKTLTFEKPAGGSVSYLYPLMFKPGS